MKMNEALNLNSRADMMEEIALMFEAFTDDILPAIKCKTFTISFRVHDKRENCLIVAWDWKNVNKVDKEFSFQVIETSENFINRIKAYLFDLTISIINIGI